MIATNLSYIITISHWIGYLRGTLSVLLGGLEQMSVLMQRRQTPGTGAQPQTAFYPRQTPLRAGLRGLAGHEGWRRVRSDPSGRPRE